MAASTPICFTESVRLKHNVLWRETTAQRDVDGIRKRIGEGGPHRASVVEHDQGRVGSIRLGSRKKEKGSGTLNFFFIGTVPIWRV